MISDTTERYMLEQLVPELEAEGYEVFLKPGRGLRPAFMADFVPDAIALGRDRNLVVEVTSRSPDASARLDRIGDLLRDRDNWELRLIWVAPASERRQPEVQSLSAMEGRIDEVRQLAAAGHHESALLLAWATFEALGRALLPGKFKTPQTPGRLVDVLTGDGYLTQAEAKTARALLKVRNSLAHGELTVRATDDELAGMTGILDGLLRLAREEADAHA